ncbi:MAG: hypothetical protein RMK79_02910 [Anaerolineae bacterium]|nr:hypothetical protein [Anaerolineae bacterium]
MGRSGAPLILHGRWGDTPLGYRVYNLCNSNGYGDYECFPDHELELDLHAAISHLRAEGFRVQAFNSRLCLMTYGEATEITLFASGRVIIEHLAPDDPHVALALTRQLLLACDLAELYLEENIP